MALSLLVPQVGELLARPLQRLTRRGSGDYGGGFLLGASLGLVFVPVRRAGARRGDGPRGEARVRHRRPSLLTLAYALGAALPMLAIAFAGQRAARAAPRPTRRPSAASRASSSRRRRSRSPSASTSELQTRIPGYTQSLQDRFERSATAQRELRELTGSKAPEAQPSGGGEGDADRLRGTRPSSRDLAPGSTPSR